MILSIYREGWAIAWKQKHHTCSGWIGHGATVADDNKHYYIFQIFLHITSTSTFSVGMLVLLAGRMQSTSTAITEKVKTTFTVHIHSGQHSLPISSVFLQYTYANCRLTRVHVRVCVHVPSVNCCSYFYETTWCSVPYIFRFRLPLKSNILVCVHSNGFLWMLKMQLLKYLISFSID